LNEPIPGYAFGSEDIPRAEITLAELAALQLSVGLNPEDREALRRAGDILAGQTHEIVRHWRAGIIASIPHLARHSRSLDGQPLPEYLHRSNRRFEQWIIDTCRRPYDQDWLNYQMEIARRHTSAKKNQTDGVHSTSFVPLRDIIGFVAVMNQTIKPYLGRTGASAEDVEQMHQAWCKSLQLQIALWAKLYSDPAAAPSQW
jgi:hypothetical protein